MQLRDGRSAAEQPTTLKKPKTSGSGTGKRKVKKSKGRGKGRQKNGWNRYSTGAPRTRAEPGQRMQGSPKPQIAAPRVQRPVLSEEEQRLQAEIRKRQYAGVLGEEARRSSIAFVFVHVFDAPEPDEWDSVRPADGSVKGNNGWDPGTIQQIANYMELSHVHNIYRNIRDVLERLEECARSGEKYDGKQRGAEITVRPKARDIQPGSLDEQLVADFMEQGLSLTKTTDHDCMDEAEEGRRWRLLLRQVAAAKAWIERRHRERVGSERVRRSACWQPSGAHATGFDVE